MVEEIEKSLTDYKNYRIISLDNCLKAVLISDIKPDSNESDDENESDAVQKSAAALCINVGSFSDPLELQGLAHYLEHMVFMGSKKYPTENDFDAFLSQNGGSSNAWTDFERTLFYFDSHFKHFENILDKFANFFISPLLSKDAMDREVTAVNSEFEMVYPNDNQRTEYLLQYLSKHDSPYRKFQCGNTKSLKDDPTSKNIDIYSYLQDFRLRMYSSHWMTLAVQSRDTLDNLERIVRSIFSGIPNNNAPRTDLSQFSTSFDTEDFYKFYYVVPVKDIKSLKLTWNLPSLIPHYKSKPIHILGHLVGHEGHGSLTHYFRKMNYIVELEAGNSAQGFDSSSFNSLFTISIMLTDKGVENITLIIGTIFSYIELLRKGIPEQLFEEYRLIKQNEFMFKELDEPVDVVESLAVNLQLFESHHILSGYDVVYECKPELTNEMISYLTADKVNIMLISPSNDSRADKTTDWYNVKYGLRDFTEEEKYQWSHPEIINDLYLPKENKFIASNFDLLDVEGCDQKPVNIVETTYTDLYKFGEIWHQLDNQFRIPKAIIDFYLWSPYISKSPLSSCLTDIVLYAINQELNAVAYDASVAGLDYRVECQESGIMIKIDGFNDKITTLFFTIIDFLKEITLEESKLFIYKEALRQIYRNLAIKSEKLASSIQKKILYPNEWLVTEKLQALKDITLQDIINFHSNLFQSMRIKSYFHGNLSHEKAKSCFMYCVDNLRLEPSEFISKTSLRAVSIGQHQIRAMNLNPNDVNTSIIINYQMGPGTIHQQAINEFLSHALSEPCFDFLRTKETLGYSVGLYDTKKKGILGLCVYVMSQVNKYSLDYCRQKMDVFFETMVLNVIETMSEDDFNEFKASFISNKLIEDIQMSNIESRNWKEIFQEEFVFHRRFAHVDVVEEMEKSDLMKFFVDHYLNKTNQKKLIVEVDVKENVLPTSVEEDLYDMHLTYLRTDPVHKPNDIYDVISKMDLILAHQINL